MTLFFNLENIEKEAKGDNYKLLLILNGMFYKKLPSKRNKIPKTTLKLEGLSFLLNPEPLFRLEYLDIAYIIQYIKLASKRDYLFYKYYGSTALPLSYFPDVNLEAIKTNPLLQITQTEIKFLYEDKEIKWH